MAFHVVFALFPGVTQLDFTGPLQVFRRAPDATTTLATSTGGALEADGLSLANLARLADIERCDLLVVPGGPAITDQFADEELLAQLRRLAGTARVLSSVCTGSLLLAAAGLLAHRVAACHWAWLDLLSLFPDVTPDAARVVRDGNLFTGGGVTAGIDLALSIVADEFSPTVAQAIQLTLQYAPAPPFSAGDPASAPPDARALVDARLSSQLAGRRAACEAAAARLVTA